MGTWTRGPQSITVPTPVLDDLGTSRSLSDGLTKLNRQRLLHKAAAELAAIAQAADEVHGVSKAAEYEAKARRVTDPADRQAYLQLAKAEREKAGGR